VAGGLCEVEIKIVPPWHLLEAGIEDIRAKGPISSVNCYGRLAIASSVIRRYGGVGEGEGIECFIQLGSVVKCSGFLVECYDALQRSITLIVKGIERIAPAAPLLSSFYFLRAAD
jgi:hypothetical protein